MHGAMVLVVALLALLLLPFVVAVARRLLKVLFLQAAVRAGLKDIGQKAIDRQPDSIRLSRRAGYAWKDNAALEKLAASLRACGFSEIGDYTVAEMPGLAIRFLINQTESAYACIYEHLKVGTWLDLVSRYQDGSGVTFTTTRDRGLEHRPQNMVVHAPGVPAEALCARMLKERPRRPLVTLDSDGAIRLFEDAYREQITWRKQKGGSAAEVARVIASRASRESKPLA